MSFGLRVSITLGLLASLLVILVSFERPPVVSVQRGERGLSIGAVVNPRTLDATVAANVPPELVPPVEQADLVGQKSSEAYQNVQVLGDLDVAVFNRVMVAITAWVSPEQGCAYCHNVENMASDEVYTKGVARRMLQMTRHINEQWAGHVAPAGVNCYTCHRGNPVPAYNWANAADEQKTAGIMQAGTGQNRAAASVAYASLPYDPFTPYLEGEQQIRVYGDEALPHGNNRSIKNAEWTYGLMMHFSQALGQNCTYCHNSRNFQNREAETHGKAYIAISMARDINNAYITPLAPVWQANPNGPRNVEGAPVESRVGPLGDPLKVNCTTCHQGAYKPLLGAPMIADYPELNLVRLTN